MITLFELHWSHYCEKIRWALDYKKLSWKKVNIHAFTKKEMKAFPCTADRYLVPMIYDSKTDKTISESSSILQYLEEEYPEAPSLFPKSSSEQQKVYNFLIELDSKLAVVGRRLGYTQIILEKPTILTHLFLPKISHSLLLSKLTASFLSMILIKRFRLELNESLHLYEELEQYLLVVAEKLCGKEFLFNNIFSAADLTLAVYLRPLLIIPFFRDHPGLAELFTWQKNILKNYAREDQLLYETLIEQHRKNNPPVRRKMSVLKNQSHFLDSIQKSIATDARAFNDHEKIWTWGILRIPYYYFFTLRTNTICQQIPTDAIR